MGKRDRILREKREKEELTLSQGLNEESGSLYFLHLLDIIPITETSIIYHESDEERETFKNLFSLFKDDLNKEKKVVSYKDDTDIIKQDANWFLGLYKAVELGKNGKINENSDKIKDETILKCLEYLRKYGKSTELKLPVLRLISILGQILISSTKKTSLLLKNGFIEDLLSIYHQNDYTLILVSKIFSFISSMCLSSKESLSKKIGQVFTQSNILKEFKEVLEEVIIKKKSSNLDLQACVYYIWTTFKQVVNGQRSDKEIERVSECFLSEGFYDLALDCLNSFSTKYNIYSCLSFINFTMKNKKVYEKLQKSKIPSSVQNLFLTSKDAKILSLSCLFFSAYCTNQETSRDFCSFDMLKRFGSLLITRGESSMYGELIFSIYAGLSAVLQGYNEETYSQIEQMGIIDIFIRDLNSNNVPLKFATSILLRRIAYMVNPQNTTYFKHLVNYRAFEILWNSFNFEYTKNKEDQYSLRIEAFLKQALMAAMNSMIKGISLEGEEKHIKYLEFLITKNEKLREIVAYFGQAEKLKNQPKSMSPWTLFILTVLLIIFLIMIPIVYGRVKNK